MSGSELPGPLPEPRTVLLCQPLLLAGLPGASFSAGVRMVASASSLCCFIGPEVLWCGWAWPVGSTDNCVMVSCEPKLSLTTYLLLEGEFVPGLAGSFRTELLWSLRPQSCSREAASVALRTGVSLHCALSKPPITLASRMCLGLYTN